MPEEAEQPDEALVPPEGLAGPADRLMTPGRVEKVMDALNRSLRGGEVDEAMLDALDWNLPRAQQFVEDYKRSLTQEQQVKERTEVPTRTIVSEIESHGDGKVRRAEAPQMSTMKSLNATGERAPDNTRGLMQVGRQRIPPRYESLLEAYYASVASQPAEE